MTEFGPAVKGIRAHYPFWRLQRDGIWEVHGAAEIPLTESGDPHPAYLDNAHPGQFLYRFDRVLREDKDLVAKAERGVLVTYFDPALHERLREAVARVWG